MSATHSKDHQPAARRVRVETGIYRSVSGKLEVCWSECGKVFFRVAKEQTLSGARAERGDILARRHKGQPVAQTSLTFEQVFEHWRNSKGVRDRRPRTRERYIRAIELHFLPHFGKRRVRDITPDDVALHLEELQRKLSGSTTGLFLTILSMVFAYACNARRGWLVSNPVASLESHERPKTVERERLTVDDDDFQKILDAASPTHHLPLTTLYATGLRVGELVGLQWGDIDLMEQVLHVRRQVTGGKVALLKSEAAKRDVPFPDELAGWLRRYKLATPWSADSDPVFPNATGGHRNYRALQSAFTRATDRAGLNAESRRKLSLHDLRHSWGSRLIAGGGDLAFVSRTMGHSNVGVTLNVYLHVWKSAEHAQVSRAIVGKAMASLRLKVPASA